MFQELFSKQKGYLDEELDYRKQALDQAHKVGERWRPSPRRGRLAWNGRLFPRPAVCLRPQTPDPEEPGPGVTVWGRCLHLSLWSPLLSEFQGALLLSSDLSPHECRHIFEMCW